MCYVITMKTEGTVILHVLYCFVCVCVCVHLRKLANVGYENCLNMCIDENMCL